MTQNAIKHHQFASNVKSYVNVFFSSNVSPNVILGTVVVISGVYGSENYIWSRAK